MTDREYTEDDIQILNLVQSVCKRPMLYTENGTLAEIYSLFIGFDIGSRDRADTDRTIVLQTLKWMWSSVADRRRTVAEFLDRFGDDSTALAAIEQFATTQNANSNTQNHDENRK